VNGWWISVDSSQFHVSSNPLTIDSDGDSLNDWEEYSSYLTNPKRIDTDFDGLPDNWEVDFGRSHGLRLILGQIISASESQSPFSHPQYQLRSNRKDTP
jgi:hypothetical protein